LIAVRRSKNSRSARSEVQSVPPMDTLQSLIPATPRLAQRCGVVL
jgi:hypothetical protein